jgi:hypothetical protein
MSDYRAISRADGLPSADLGNATSETIFKKTGTTVSKCNLPANSELSNTMFKVRAAGKVTGGTTTNFTLTLYFGFSSTIGSNTAIEASTARAVNSVSANWFIEACCMWDDASNKIAGYGRSMINNLYDVEAALNNQITGADPDADTELGFTVTGLFSATSAGNAAIMTVFEVIGE